MCVCDRTATSTETTRRASKTYFFEYTYIGGFYIVSRVCIRLRTRAHVCTIHAERAHFCRIYIYIYRGPTVLLSRWPGLKEALYDIRVRGRSFACLRFSGHDAAAHTHTHTSDATSFAIYVPDICSASSNIRIHKDFHSIFPVDASLAAA